MGHVLVVLTCWLVLLGSASAQLEGGFYLDKNSYVAREPIYLTFNITNTTDRALALQWECGSYRIQIWRDIRPPVQSAAKSCR